MAPLCDHPTVLKSGRYVTCGTCGMRATVKAWLSRKPRQGARIGSGGRSKYGAIRTVVHGRTFDSKAEARRYAELLLMEKADKIHILECQPEFELIVPKPNGSLLAKIGNYRGDFRYCECAGGRNNCGWCAVVVEDVKGFKTPLYRWKKKHVEAQYGITIREIR